jgi:hypothetical protein
MKRGMERKREMERREKEEL